MSKKNKINHQKYQVDSDILDSDDNNTIMRLKNSHFKKILENNSSNTPDTSTSETSTSETSTSETSTSETSTSESSENSVEMKNDKKNANNNGIVLSKKIKTNNNEIFKELIRYQLPDVPYQWKLNINDMKRICKYIDTSIFDRNNCCIWNGYITNMNNSNKGTYVNFYFKNKKVALHRLLYSNFMAPLDSSEYLKFNCENKGICCNVYHYEKYKYSKNYNMSKKEPKQKEAKKEINDVSIMDTDEYGKIVIDFD